jgi:GcrA cell cycle regulator
MSWNETKIEKLKDLWSKGHTASQIAEMLGDTTRNAVIGKAHRLNLEARAPSKKSSTINRQDSTKQIKKSIQPMSRKSRFQSILLDKNFESEKPTTLENLTEKTCKWPIGHPDEDNFYFCGRSPEGEFPYCKLHVLYAFQPKGQKEDLINKEDDVPAFLEKKIKSA